MRAGTGGNSGRGEDLKSWVPQGACGFDSRPRHKIPQETRRSIGSRRDQCFGQTATDPALSRLGPGKPPIAAFLYCSVLSGVWPVRLRRFPEQLRSAARRRGEHVVPHEVVNHQIHLVWSLELVDVAGTYRLAMDDVRQPLRHELRRIERRCGDEM